MFASFDIHTDLALEDKERFESDQVEISGVILEEKYDEIVEFAVQSGKVSVSLLQRRFKLGYNRAARIMDQLSDAGVVGPEEGTKPRKVLMTLEEFENYVENNL